MSRIHAKTVGIMAVATAVAALSQAPAFAQTNTDGSDVKWVGADQTGVDLLKRLNTDGDDTFEMPEIMRLAVAVFGEINPDGDQTLEPDETKGRLAEADFPDQDFPNNQQDAGDKTVDLYQWLTIARERFKTADENNDGKIDANELDAATGAGLKAMIVPTSLI